MACEKRTKTGSCGHFQCPYANETEHGYDCVDVREGFCELGEDCLAKCPHSWRGSDTATQEKAIAAFNG